MPFGITRNSGPHVDITYTISILDLDPKHGYPQSSVIFASVVNFITDV
jgi:hypothetical protein